MNTQSNDRHAWTQERLEAYVAGALTPEERIGVDAHAAECPDCRDTLRALGELERKMRGLFAAARPGTDFEQRIIGRLWQATWRTRLGTPTMKRVRFAIAASLLLASAGLAANYAVDNNVLSNPLSGMLADSRHGFLPGWVEGNAGSALPQYDRYENTLQPAEVGRVAAMANAAKMQGERVNYRATLERLGSSDGKSNSTSLTHAGDLQKEIGGLQREKAARKSDLANSQASTIALTAQNAELNRKNEELATGLEAARNSIHLLQEPLAAASEKQRGGQVTDGDRTVRVYDIHDLVTATDAGVKPPTFNLQTVGAVSGQNVAAGVVHVERNNPNSGPAGDSNGVDNIFATAAGKGDNGKTTDSSVPGRININSVNYDALKTLPLGSLGNTSGMAQIGADSTTLVSGHFDGGYIYNNRNHTTDSPVASNFTINKIDLHATKAPDDQKSKFLVGSGISSSSGLIVQKTPDGETLQRPRINLGSTNALTSVTAPDGGTLLVGGQKLSGAAQEETDNNGAPTKILAAGGGDANGLPPASPTVSPPPTTAPSPAVQATVTSQKVIRSGTMEFEVRSFDDATDTINKVVTEEGGFVAGTNSEKLANGKVKGTITVRVDPGRLDRVVLKLRGLGDLKTQQISAQDITKEYTDLESELRANRSMEERMLDIIKNGKGSIKELVEAEKQLGVYRERIEKTEGEKRYYDNLVGLSTLSITCYEKDIQAAASAAETENVVMSIETEDVESTFAAAKAAIEKEAGGRIIKAGLRRLEAGQLAAQIVCEVPADKADLLLVGFKQLGKVAGLDRLRSQSTPGGQAAPLAHAKVEQKNTQIALTLYNLANIAPRQTAVLVIAVPNVEEAYNAVLHRVRQDAPLSPATDKHSETPARPVGVVATSNLTGQRPEQMTADIRADVRTVEAPAVLAAIRGLGEVMSSAMTENPDTANVTPSKQGIQLRLVAVAAVPPRDTQTLQVAAADVPAAYGKLLDALRPLEGEKGGRIVAAQLNQQDAHNVAATLEVELRRTDQGIFDAALAATGAQVVARNVTRSTDATNTLDTKVRYTMTLVAADSLPAREMISAGIEVEDVDRALADVRSAVAAAHGRELDAGTAKDAGGHVTARLAVETPLAESAALAARLGALGKVRTNEISRNLQGQEGTLAKARYEITLTNGQMLVPQDKSIAATLRAAVAASLAALLWSLYLIVNGLLVVGPWVLVGWVGWRVLKRPKKASP